MFGVGQPVALSNAHAARRELVFPSTTFFGRSATCCFHRDGSVLPFSSSTTNNDVHHVALHYGHRAVIAALSLRVRHMTKMTLCLMVWAGSYIARAAETGGTNPPRECSSTPWISAVYGHTHSPDTRGNTVVRWHEYRAHSSSVLFSRATSYIF